MKTEELKQSRADHNVMALSIENIRKNVVPEIKKTVEILSTIDSSRSSVSSQPSKQEIQLFQDQKLISQLQFYKETLQREYATKLQQVNRKNQVLLEKSNRQHQTQNEALKKKQLQLQEELNKLRSSQRKNMHETARENRQKKNQTEMNQFQQKMEVEFKKLRDQLKQKDQELVLVKSKHQEEIKKKALDFDEASKTYTASLKQAQSQINEKMSEIEKKETEIMILKNNLKEKEKQIDEMKLNSTKMTDPVNFLKGREQQFNEFLQELVNYHFQRPNTIKQNNIRRFGIIGKKQSGKTSLLNECFGSKMSLENEQSFEFVRLVNKIEKKDDVIQFYDSIGFSQKVSYLSFDVIKHIITMDKLFIVYEGPITEITQLIQIVLTIKPITSLVFIKSKYDILNQIDKEDDKDQLKKIYASVPKGDNNKVRRGQIKEENQDDDEDFQIYAFSCKKQAKRTHNKQVKKIITGEWS